MHERTRKRGQPRIQHNQYADLTVPDIGALQPSLNVSIVVSGIKTRESLELVLACLAAQTYPSHLIEVIIIASGEGPQLSLPDFASGQSVKLHIDRCKMPATALHSGIAISKGDVIFLLDGARLLDRDHIEAHMRWHHAIDYATVIGGTTFVEPLSDDMKLADAYQLVASGQAHVTLGRQQPGAKESRPVGIRNEGYGATNRAIFSWTRRLDEDSRSIDPSILVDADLEFGYRLAQCGSVFVIEENARSWCAEGHNDGLDRGMALSYAESVLSHRIPLRRDWRKEPGRQWKVPYVDVIVDVGDSSFDDVRASVVGALASDLTDLGVTIVAPWRTLDRAQEDTDFHNTLRLIRESFIHDGRVKLVETMSATSAPVPFRFVCPAGAVLTPGALTRLNGLANDERYGMVLLAFPRGSDLLIARLERTEAMARAHALRLPGEDVADVVDEIFGTRWIDGAEWALTSARNVVPASSPSILRNEVDRWRRLAEQRNVEIERFRTELTQIKSGIRPAVSLRDHLMMSARRKVAGIPMAKKLYRRVKRSVS